MFFARSTIAFLSSTLLLGGEVAASQNLTKLYGPHLSSGAKILDPSQPNYADQVPGRWTVWHQPTFSGTITPATEKDVQTIVDISVKNDIRFLAVTSGHGFSLKDSSQKDVVQIDLQNFNNIDIDTDANTMTIGGGVVFGDAVQALYSKGKEITVGNAECVGFNGAAVGAGIGTLQGLHGLTVDSLLSARLVTASGEVVTVSDSQNPDLFWAIRGAGANFGVITSATYNVYDATNKGQVTNADFIFSPLSNRSVFEFVQTFDDDMPKFLTIQVAMSYNHTTKAPALLVNLIAHAPQTDIQKYIDQLKTIGPITSRVVSVPWTALPHTLFFGVPGKGNCVNGTYNNLYSMGLNKTSPETFEDYFSDFATFSEAHPTYAGTLNVQRYSSEKVISNTDGGVYPWREIKTHLLFSNMYPDSSLDGAVNKFMQSTRDGFQAASGFSELEVYINYAHGDEGPEVWYGASNVAKLTSLKNKWDPANLFTGGHPIL